MKSLLLFLFLFSGATSLWATHIRGGYITARRISGFKYEFLLTIYRDTASPVVNDSNELHPDINSSDVLNSPNIEPVQRIVGKGTEIWQYRYEYTYKSPGVYTAYHYREFRNNNVLNMDNSVGTTFYVETKVTIDPFLAFDQSPIITKAAVDFAVAGVVYRYNPGAYDPDGDSLSYQSVPSRQFLQGQNVSAIVSNYKVPAVRSGGQDTSGQVAAYMTLNPVTGDLVWNCPRMVGEYNTAIKIVQWRKLRANRPKRDSIGFVLLDIQIIVKDSRNKRPILKLPADTCVVAGSFLEARIWASDPDIGDRVIISFTGELDTILPKTTRARFQQISKNQPPFYGDFEWNVGCVHVRREPYQAVFTAEDIPVNGFPSLTDTRVWRIKVVGPSPVVTHLRPEGNGKLRLSWLPYICQNADKIHIYRKIDSTMIGLDTCDPGMPDGFGFVKIAEVSGSDTTFLDDNNGAGLKKGPTYCYRIVAGFPEPAGGESLVSNEICRPLNLDIPVITNVDVTKTGVADGEIFIRWTTPFFIDTVSFKPPYTYQLVRFAGNAPGVVVKATTDTTDTTFTDTGLNTTTNIYHYQLRFLYGSLLNLVDSTPKASAVRLELQPGIKQITLNWSASVPWSNDDLFHAVYRKIDGNFIKIDSVSGIGGRYTYTDKGTYNNAPLSDTIVYCYFVDTRGSYSNPLITSPLINSSQENCASPTDTVRPCPPPEVVIQDPPNFKCDDCELLRTQTEFNRTIRWRSMATDTCGTDVNRYRIYFSEYEEDTLRLLATVTDTFYIHTNLTSLAGCYAVTAVDRSGNESFVINKTCVDNCVVFDLPNLITPDRNEANDVFTPRCVSRSFIENVHFTVYNRWGKKVFDDDVDPEINWGGVNETNSTSVVNGVYFYLAEVKAKRLHRSDEKMFFKGWILLQKP